MNSWTTQAESGGADAPSLRRRLADIGAREVSPLAFMVFAVLVVVVALWVPIRLSIEHPRWATATVVGKYLTSVEDSTLENLSYTFIVDGRRFSGSSEVSEATYRRMTIGGSLPVRYVGGDPSVNRYVADRFVNTWELALGGLYLLVIPLLPVRWWRDRSRRKRSSGT